MFRIMLIGALLGLAVPYKLVDDALSPVLQEILIQQDSSCDIPLPSKFTVQLMPSFMFAEDTMGVCLYGLTSRTILINQAQWDVLAPETRFQLLAHEYAHCVLDKEHVQDYSNYMYPVFVELYYTEVAKQLKQNAKEYCDRERLKSLFKQAPRSIK